MGKWISSVDMYKKKSKKTDQTIKSLLKSADKDLNSLNKKLNKKLNKIHKEAEKIKAQEKREKEKAEKEEAKRYQQNKAYIKSLYDNLMANQKVVNTSNNPENVRKGLDNMLDILNEFEEIGEDTLEYYGLEINCKETSDMILKNYKQMINQAKERSKK